MAPDRITADEIAGRLPRQGRVWISGCSTDGPVLKSAWARQSLPGLTFTGIFVPGLNDLEPVLNTAARLETFFMTPEMAKAPNRIDFLPLCYRDIGQHLRAAPPDAAVVMLAPPDENGLCSFGPVTDFIADIWQDIPTIIAHINPALPATRGTPGIPFDRLTAVVEAESPLPQQSPGMDDTARAIATHAADLIPDGATLQAGVGRIPEAILSGLTDKRDLAIHSGLIGDSTLDLLEAGALRPCNPITAGVAIGTDRLYGSVGRDEFTFRPPSHTHAIDILSRIDPLVTINSAIEVDLNGYVHAEATPRGPISGPGGASDFAAGARGPNDLRIIALPSTAGKSRVSRIVAAGAGTGPVSLGRFDVDVIVTEHGIADLRGKSPAARRAALIAIADPDHRDTLSASPE
ncbi:MAG: acetyl-CoA hydrolase/transferase C-terminal domain-containing protein [Pseudomonadota bacterium]|nr:acetyl-CoA hydrolase/transferase C-terminal domain-containing protein [Pseudomonadota bacterium]